MADRSRLVGSLSTEDERLSTLLRSGNYRSWRAKVEAVGGCAKPIILAGSSYWETRDGRRLKGVDGSIFAACNNRRESRCPSCAQRYSADTFHLIRSGLCGGKGIAESVSSHPRLFVTLTAPSFGAVHNRPTTRTGRARRCACDEFHHEHDTRLGSPINPAGYDYVGAVLWQAYAPELWRRFTIATSRHLARALGIPAGELRDHLRVSYAKVAEYQRRGLVHFHAVIRVDGPTGADSHPPRGVTPELLADVVRTAAAAVYVDSPDSPATGSRRLVWGEQVDCEEIAATDPDDPAQLVHDRKVAAYVAKYATKGTGQTVGTDTPIRSEQHLADLCISDHARAMIRTAWDLGGLTEFADLRLRKWAHMLGFRGHFLTKSRHYSTTFTELRSARRDHRFARELAVLGIEDTAEVVVVNNWTMTGIGYRNDAERQLAEAIATTTLERRKARQTDLAEVA